MADTNDKGVVRPKLPDNPTREQIEEFFKDDTFAYKQAGCRIVEGWKGHGVTEMPLVKGIHYNAEGGVMGGAIFTLADYALAIASMCGRASSVSIANTIEFLKGTKGTKLIATCDADRIGRRTGFYTVDVTDEYGEHIARMVATCYHPVLVD